MVSARLALALALRTAASLRATTPCLFDESNVLVTSSTNMSSQTVANDCNVLRLQRVTAADVWLLDGGNIKTGEFSAFSGTVGWGIYDNSASGHPGNLLASGSDVSPDVDLTFLGAYTTDDVFRVRVHFDPPVTLSAGSYWLALHEGTWGSAQDGSTISWMNAGGTRGLPVEVAGTTPSTWTPESWESSFVVFATEVIEAQEYWCCLDVNISMGVWADEFWLPGATTPSALSVWLRDGEINDDGQLGNFSGTLSWAIYANDGGQPVGSSAAPIATGEDSSPELTDTGFNNGGDVVRATIELSGAPLLSAGYYWLAIHEGSWGSPNDGTSVYWENSSDYDAGTTIGSWDLGTPSSDWSQNEPWDSALVLYPAGSVTSDLLFASGFEAHSLCGWSSFVSSGDCP